LGWGLTQRAVSWVAWEGKVWLFFKVGKWDLKNFPRNYSYGGVRWGVWRKRTVFFFFFFFFFFFWYGDLMKILFSKKYFIKIISFFGEWKIFNTKNSLKKFN
jgi:hypothetical protein